MSNWKERLKGGFGEQDRAFAFSDFDHQRAKRALWDAKSEGVHEDAVIKFVKEFLAAGGCTKEHIENQVVEVARAYRWVGPLPRREAVVLVVARSAEVLSESQVANEATQLLSNARNQNLANAPGDGERDSSVSPAEVREYVEELELKNVVERTGPP